jgi:hypothetical protein
MCAQGNLWKVPVGDGFHASAQLLKERLCHVFMRLVLVENRFVAPYCQPIVTTKRFLVRLNLLRSPPLRSDEAALHLKFGYVIERMRSPKCCVIDRFLEAHTGGL